MTDQPTISFAFCHFDLLGRNPSPASPRADGRFSSRSAVVSPLDCLPHPSVPNRSRLSPLPSAPSIGRTPLANSPVGRHSPR